MHRNLLKSAVSISTLALCIGVAGCSSGDASAIPKSSDATNGPTHTAPRDSDSSPSTDGHGTQDHGSKRQASPTETFTGTNDESPAKSGGGAATTKDGPEPSGAPNPQTPPLVPENPKSQTSVLAKLPGSPSQACVVVGARKDVRSGGIAMGNFRTARAQFKAAGTKYERPVVDLYVIPQSRKMRGATIKLTPLSAKGQPTTAQVDQVETADVWKYYSVHLGIPGPGTWQIRVKSGNDQGCFKVEFSR